MARQCSPNSARPSPHCLNQEDVLVFRGFDELVNQASRLLGEVSLTTLTGRLFRPACPS